MLPGMSLDHSYNRLWPRSQALIQLFVASSTKSASDEKLIELSSLETRLGLILSALLVYHAALAVKRLCLPRFAVSNNVVLHTEYMM